jgi:hypothetical protein
MSPEAISAIIAGSGFVLSVIGSAFIAGLRWGTVRTRLEMLESNQDRLATKDQLAGVKEDVAEIKGMFRMTLRDGKDGSYQ